MRLRAAALSLAVPAALVLSGCSDEGSVSEGAGAAGSADTTITVSATDSACRLSSATAKPGSVAFVVTNTGTKVTEFYLYEGTEVRGEVENIAPGLTRTLTVDVTAGAYTTACKPGMTGTGIRAPFVVR